MDITISITGSQDDITGRIVEHVAEAVRYMLLDDIRKQFSDVVQRELGRTLSSAVRDALKDGIPTRDPDGTESKVSVDQFVRRYMERKEPARYGGIDRTRMQSSVDAVLKDVLPDTVRTVLTESMDEIMKLVSSNIHEVIAARLTR